MNCEQQNNFADVNVTLSENTVHNHTFYWHISAVETLIELLH